MRFRRDDQSDDTAINITSLMDLMFILLIFFMATTTFKQEDSIELDLPESRQQSSMSSDTKVLVINVRKIKGNEQNYYVVASKSLTLMQLSETVREAVEKDPAQKVLIRGDRWAYHEQVAAAARVCRNAGLLKAQIGYDSKPLGGKKAVKKP